MSRQPDGSLGVWPSWCGFVVSREIVEAVGLPMGELFWWAEDTEYLQWRIPEAGYERQVVGDAIVDHDAIRQGDGVPVVEVLLRGAEHALRAPAREAAGGPVPAQRVQAVRPGPCCASTEGRIRRLGVMARGLWDGARGKLGMRFPVEPMQERAGRVPDRPGPP